MLSLFLLAAALPFSCLAGNPHKDEARFEHRILSTLDFSVDPCVDVYKFTCNKIMPAGSPSQNNTFINMALNTYSNLILLLIKIRHDKSAKLPVSVRKAATLFDSCLNVRNIDGLIPSELMHFNKTCLGTQVKVKPPKLEGFSPERLLPCLQILEAAMGPALDYIYNIYGGYAPDLKKSQGIMTAIKEAFIQNVHELKWASPIFKKNVLKKLNSMKFYNGYPKWVKNTKDLERYFASLGKMTGNFRIDVQTLYVYFKWAPKPLPRNTDWPEYMPPSTMVNALYYPATNFFYLPSAIQASPFYEPDRPAYFNYASLGFVIAHEMTHAVDSPRDTATWTPDAIKVYKKQAKCFDAQYRKFPTKGSPINAKKTRQENIADNGALNHAYTAYRNWLKKKSENLVSGYTPSHLFFLSYTYTWCDTDGDHYSASTHSPAKARTTVPLSMFQPFAATYQCNSTEPMVSKVRCKLW